MTTAAAEERALSLTDSQAFCTNVTRTHARNFFYGLKLLPEQKRLSMFALYTWMRRADDLADDIKTGDVDRRGQLESFRANTHAAIAGESISDSSWPGWLAFINCVRQDNIPVRLFDAMIDGQLQDLNFSQPQNFEELYNYCYRVAGVVGVASIHIWGFTGGEATESLAVDCGVAFQLTNILRDLTEDARNGRIYLPKDELTRFEVMPDQFTKRISSPSFLRMMKFQIERAEGYFYQSGRLDGFIAPDSRCALQAMTDIYQGILRKIARKPDKVLRTRVRLSGWAKSKIALRAWQNAKREKAKNPYG
ncbi:MAG TPA: phytoene/squalene synthase family protein [Phycisphaerae bacterium]|nr:phytoene/squalene synthase family protein [Phycisphaerae bacterium]